MSTYGMNVTDAPTAPPEGEARTFWVTSAVSWPAGIEWSTDPDGGTAPTVTSAALVSLATVGGVTYGVLGASFTTVAAPDTTDPTAGTLGMVMDAYAATGTVTGAADETAMAAAPYSFKLDAGAWTAYQSSPIYEWTGLSAETAYTFAHRVIDAAGNVTEGTPVTDMTDAAPVDSTPPTVGTLAGSSITDDGFTLTVSAADDETALHAQPYRFSTDNGATYTAYQTSPVYAATRLDPSTAYTCKHQTRDAAGNVSTGTAITVTTSASSTLVIGLSDTFTGADGSLSSHTADTGQTWAGSLSTSQILSNRLKASNVFISNAGVAREASVEFTFSATGADAQLFPWHDGVTTASGTGPRGYVNQNGQVSLSNITVTYNASGGTNYYTPVGFLTLTTATAHAMLLTYNGTNVALYVNGTKIIEGTPTTPLTATHTFVNGTLSGTRFDNLVVKIPA